MKLLILEFLIFVALYTDVKYNKIPNILTFSGMLLGIIINFHDGFISSIQALAIVIVGYLPVYAMGIMAAGDVKIMMAISLILGWNLTITSVLLIVFINLIITLSILYLKNRLSGVLNNTIEDIKYRLFLLISLNKKNILEKPTSTKETHIPYMPAVVFGVNIALIISCQLG